MNEQSTSLEIAIYRRNPAAGWNVNEVDVGSLLNQLTEEPFYLAGVGEDGSVQLKIQRTHEWEIVIGLILIGSGIFLTGALTELGKRSGSWLADRIKSLRATGSAGAANPEVRAPGTAPVVVNPNDPDRSNDAISKLITEAAKKGLRVQLIVEPVE